MRKRFPQIPQCHASVVAKTVQKILDVTITWKIEAAGKIDADIAVTKDDEFPDQIGRAHV